VKDTNSQQLYFDEFTPTVEISADKTKHYRLENDPPFRNSIIKFSG
jgi:hypothetical protein